jgi:hypothetical protein
VARRVRRKERLRSLVPWLEKYGGALLVGALSGTVFAGERGPSFVLSYLYISAMGLLYGKRQSLPAVALSLLREQKIYVNRTLSDDVPDLAAPVVYEGRTIAVIELFGMDFDQWSFAQQNLLAVTARLIAASLGRAYAWEREAAERKYLPGTRILRAAEFDRVLAAIGYREKLASDYPASLVPILGGPRDAASLDAVLSRVIRAEDFVGEHAGGIYLLLPDVTGETLALVRQRLARGYREGRGRGGAVVMMLGLAVHLLLTAADAFAAIRYWDRRPEHE